MFSVIAVTITMIHIRNIAVISVATKFLVNVLSCRCHREMPAVLFLSPLKLGFL